MNETIIQKPNFETLRKRGFFCVDMQYHTVASDGSAKIKDVVNKAKQLGIGVAITDHNEISGVLEAEGTSDVLLIPAIEVNCTEGPDMLFYFYTIKDLERFFNKNVRDFRNKDTHGRSKIPIKSIIEKAKSYKCVIAAPHPCGSAWKDLKTFLQNKNLTYLVKDIHAFETFNGEQFMKNNIKSIQWNQQLNKGIFGGSDGHCLFELGSVVTYSKAKTIKGFLNNVVKKNTNVIGKKFPLPYYIIPALVSLKNHLKFGVPSFVFNGELRKPFKV